MAAIRSAVRVYYTEYNDYPLKWRRGQIIGYPAFGDELASAGLNPDSLNGTYFDKWRYYLYLYEWPNDGYHHIMVYPYGPEHTLETPLAPRHNEAIRIVDNEHTWDYLIMWLKNGKIKQSGISRSGYPLDDGTPP
jgi:hypothetical protein